METGVIAVFDIGRMGRGVYPKACAFTELLHGADTRKAAIVHCSSLNNENLTEHLDLWLSAAIREEVERRFYAKINEQASLQHLIDDPTFMADPMNHVGLFADHGVVHARDVAAQVLTVLDMVHGVLIPRRDARRFAFMQGLGVLLAYFHDIGMVDFSRFGRIMHPEFAAQAAFDPALDDIVEAIWQENSGGVAWHLHTLADTGALRQDPKLVLRELLSLSICHSKSKVPVAVLNDPFALRRQLIHVVTTALPVLFAEQQAETPDAQETLPGPHTEQALLNLHVARFAPAFPDHAYLWLEPGGASAALMEDVIDTARVLRAADALRQRGATLETSGQYQVFVDQHHGNAIYALRLGAAKLFMLELSDPISAGEANIASTELDLTGDLHISFHRGLFRNPGATEHAAHCAARIVLDIQSDVIDSFQRATPSTDLKDAREMAILLEETNDHAPFVQMVKTALAALEPASAARVRFMPSMANASPAERTRYLAAAPTTWDMSTRRYLLAQLAQSGHRSDRIDPQLAFDHVRLVTLGPGDVLIEASAPSAFVYLPLGPGLIISPLGGYQSFPAVPWVLLGATGVVRGAERSATIVAERGVQVVVIPQSVYLAHWHNTLSVEEFQDAVRRAAMTAP